MNIEVGLEKRGGNNAPWETRRVPTEAVRSSFERLVRGDRSQLIMVPLEEAGEPVGENLNEKKEGDITVMERLERLENQIDNLVERMERLVEKQDERDEYDISSLGKRK